MHSKTIEWLGAGTGVLGTALIAVSPLTIWWGFVSYAVSNACWIGVARGQRMGGLAAMHGCYVFLTIVGLVSHWPFAAGGAL